LPLSRGCPGLDADMVDAEVEQVKVERGAEFRPIIGLHPLHLKGQFRHHVVDEGDGSLLVAARVGAQHPQPGAVVDRGERVILLPPACLA
jgi:hypothetical protein